MYEPDFRDRLYIRLGKNKRDRRLAEYIAAVIIGKKDVSRAVAKFREKFITMQYCLPEEQTGPLVDELINCIIKL